MRTIPAGEFKAKCLKIMDEVAATGEPVLVTKRGKPVVSVRVPEVSQSKRKSIFGRLRHAGIVRGDIVSPEFTDEEWDRMHEERWRDFDKGSSE